MTNFTLLYVEDDTDAQEKMKMMLEDSVKELYQAHDGAEGFSIFMEKKPDVILTDINMPILNGLSMVEKIKDVDSTVPVIVMSAFDNRESLLRAINIGVDYFIPKPIDMDILEDRLRIFS
jgi:DNA-binding response OmpR family regulator